MHFHTIFIDAGKKIGAVRRAKEGSTNFGDYLVIFCGNTSSTKSCFWRPWLSWFWLTTRTMTDLKRIRKPAFSFSVPTKLSNWGAEILPKSLKIGFRTHGHQGVKMEAPANGDVFFGWPQWPKTHKTIKTHWKCLRENTLIYYRVCLNWAHGVTPPHIFLKIFRNVAYLDILCFAECDHIRKKNMQNKCNILWANMSAFSPGRKSGKTKFWASQGWRPIFFPA